MRIVGPHSRRTWLVVALGLMVVGGLGATLTASGIAGADADRERNAFTSSSAEVASTLELAIQHEQDLIVSASALLVDDPMMRTAAFTRWVDLVQALERYPELLGIAQLTLVSASELSSFAAWATSDVAGPFGSGTPFAPFPAGDRPSYCFAGASANRPGSPAPPPGFDFCVGDSGRALLLSRDTGIGSYEPAKVPGVGTILGIQIPLYRGGEIPATVSARRQAFLGWIGMGVDPQIVLDRALAAHGDLGAAIRYHNGTSDVVFGHGRASGAQTATTDLHNGWTVRTFGRPVHAGVTSNPVALALLVAGYAFSLLLGLFVLVLATGRARAERLVRLKTDELRHQALHDPLTGLANRVLVADRVGQLLARSRRNGTLAAALYLDLDGFKAVNDTLGHDAGDRLLQAVAQRLTSAVREADTIARMGGDEFVILIDGATLDAAPELVAERLLDVFRHPFELEAGRPVVWVSTSIGIATGERGSADELIRDADVAMYQAKAAGKHGYVVFQPEMESALRHSTELELDLRCALEHEQFRLVYQPVYNLDDLSVVSVEALLRWEHPTLGVVQPDEFIPILERSGLIVDVGRWALDDASRQMAEWHARGVRLSVSVNVSAVQFESDAIIEHVRLALERSQLDPSFLTLEITETALMRDVGQSALRLETIKSLGVQVAIDDFGTGYSSLAYLQRLPVDSLKIDRSFVSAVRASSDSRAVVRTIVQLGRDLGLKTLAEGVETTEQIDELRGDRVDEGQGFLLACPLDPETLERTILFDALGPVSLH